MQFFAPGAFQADAQGEASADFGPLWPLLKDAGDPFGATGGHFGRSRRSFQSRLGTNLYNFGDLGQLVKIALFSR